MAEEHLTLTSALDQLAELDKYNQWIFEQFSDYLDVASSKSDRERAISPHFFAPRDVKSLQLMLFLHIAASWNAILRIVPTFALVSSILHNPRLQKQLRIHSIPSSA